MSAILVIEDDPGIRTAVPRRTGPVGGMPAEVWRQACVGSRIPARADA